MSATASWEAWKRALVWIPVFVAFHDCIASAHWVEGLPTRSSGDDETDAPQESPGIVLAERLSPRLYRYTRGDIVLMKVGPQSVVGCRSPIDPRKTMFRRLIGVEGDWVAIPGEARVEKVPKGNCWVEEAGGGCAEGGDSRTKFGAIPLALIQGTASRVLWPPSRWGALEPQLPPGRIIAMGSFSTASVQDVDW